MLSQPGATRGGRYLAYLRDVFEELGRGRGYRHAAGTHVSAVGFKVMYHQLPVDRARAVTPGGRGLLGNASLVDVLRFCRAADIKVARRGVVMF